ncbi:hypothetical protein ACPV51_24190 [Vibrio astriarenae]
MGKFERKYWFSHVVFELACYFIDKEKEQTSSFQGVIKDIILTWGLDKEL